MYWFDHDKCQKSIYFFDNRADIANVGGIVP
jgi:hypothetical protein